MRKRVCGDLLERLGQDLFGAVLHCLDDPADLIRSTSVCKSWRRLVITTGFCRDLCLRMIPEISCFVRAIEVGGLSNTLEFDSNCPAQWQKLESEHRIYAYLGYRIASPRFLTEIAMRSIVASNNTMLRNKTYVISSYFSSMVKDSLTFRLSCKLCVVHEIKIQLLRAHDIRKCTCLPIQNMRFRLGQMRNENATTEDLLAGNSIWTYVSPEFSMIETDDFQSFKPQRPVICIGGILQIELLSTVPSVKLPIRHYVVKAVGYPLAPAFDVSLLNRMENSILIYFPTAIPCLEDASCSSKFRLWKRRKWRGTKKHIIHLLRSIISSIGKFLRHKSLKMGVAGMRFIFSRRTSIMLSSSRVGKQESRNSKFSSFSR